MLGTRGQVSPWGAAQGHTRPGKASDCLPLPASLTVSSSSHRKIRSAHFLWIPISLTKNCVHFHRAQGIEISKRASSRANTHLFCYLSRREEEGLFLTPDPFLRCSQRPRLGRRRVVGTHSCLLWAAGAATRATAAVQWNPGTPVQRVGVLTSLHH